MSCFPPPGLSSLVVGAAGEFPFNPVFTALPVPQDDGATINFEGQAVYAALAEFRDGYKAADLIPLIAQHAPGWEIETLGGGKIPLIWTSLDPIPTWLDFAKTLGPPPSGHQWLYVVMKAPAGGTSLERERSPVIVGFIYRVMKLWGISEGNAPPPKTTIAPATTDILPWIVGGAIVTVMGAGYIAWKKGWLKKWLP